MPNFLSIRWTKFLSQAEKTQKWTKNSFQMYGLFKKIENNSKCHCRQFLIILKSQNYKKN